MLYSELSLPEQLQHTLAAMEFSEMTPIQERSIPVAMDGLDILGSAQTGTGKTAAFLVPAVLQTLINPKATALVILPTRELAKQVNDVATKLLGRRSKTRSVCLIGGDSMDKQLKTLKQNPRIIVGTPGRINDHLKRGSLSLHHCQMVTLDETDRMLDMGFGIQIEEIFEHIEHKPQILMFSATLPKNIVKLSNKYLEDPVRIAIEPTPEQALKIEHTALRLTEKGKFDALLEEIRNREGTIIIFGKTRLMTQKVADRLRKEGIDAEAIHGDLRQHKRERLIRNFHAKKFRILVATDVAARGLDIPHIEHVIINDLPQVAEDYIHRIGRTGRNGKSGKAIVFLTPRDNRQWKQICRILPKEIQASESYGSYEAEMEAESDFKNSRRNEEKNRRGKNRRSDEGRPNKKRKDDKRKKMYGEGGDGYDPLKQGAARRIAAKGQGRSDKPARNKSERKEDAINISRFYQDNEAKQKPRRRNSEDGERGDFRAPRRERSREDGDRSDYRAPRRERSREDGDRSDYKAPRRERSREDGDRGDFRNSNRRNKPQGDASKGDFKSSNRRKRGDTWSDEATGERQSRRDGEKKSFSKNSGPKKTGWAKGKKSKPPRRAAS